MDKCQRWIVEKLCEVHGDPLVEGLAPSPAYFFTRNFAEQELFYLLPYDEEFSFENAELLQQHSLGSLESS